MAHATLKSHGAAALSLAQAKATFSAVVNSVEQKRRPITILRRGVPVAQIVPFPGASASILRGSMAGKGRELGDIVSPLDVEWSPADE
jgi:prevent-host-death family protein